MVNVTGNSTRAAQKDASQEPMMRAIYEGLKISEETGELIAPALASALDNNAAHKLWQKVAESLQDQQGHTSHHFEIQRAAYDSVGKAIRKSELVAGVAPVARSQSLS